MSPREGEAAPAGLRAPARATRSPHTLSLIFESTLLLHLASFPGLRKDGPRRRRTQACRVRPSPGVVSSEGPGSPARHLSRGDGGRRSLLAGRAVPAPGWPFKRPCLVRRGRAGGADRRRRPGPSSLPFPPPPSARPSLPRSPRRSLARLPGARSASASRLGDLVRGVEREPGPDARPGAGAGGWVDRRQPPGKPESQWLRWAARG